MEKETFEELPIGKIMVLSSSGKAVPLTIEAKIDKHHIMVVNDLAADSTDDLAGYKLYVNTTIIDSLEIAPEWVQELYGVPDSKCPKGCA